MRKPKDRSVRCISHSILLAGVSCVMLAILLSSCSPKLSVMEESQQEENNQLDTRYSIIFIIHGDGDYLYLDVNNNEHNADEETVMNAKKVAEQNPNAEVFIFHQKPKTNFLLFFPRKDGEFYYYRNGQLVANELYWRDQELANLDTEAEFYNSFRAESQSGIVRMFLYFGHEIPEFGGAGYDVSYPDRAFTVHDLANGLKGLTKDSTKFDLMVLSTCYGGTPYTIGTLGPYARTIIASPDNLHLSYFDLSGLERLDLNLKDGDIPMFAKRFARQSFDKLTGSIETTVSVAVYKVKKAQNFLNSVNKNYNLTLDSLKELTEADLAVFGHCDCADIPAYRISTIKDGVDLFYRPSRFGRSKNKQNHSGWECWKN